MIVPIRAERRKFHFRYLISSQEGIPIRTFSCFLYPSRCPSFRPLSISSKTSLMAKSPMTAGMKVIPMSRPLYPKVNRWVPEMGEVPNVAKKSPMPAPITFLRTDFPPIPEHTLSPMTAKAKYSASPNSRAMVERGRETAARQIVLKIPPSVEAKMAIPRAFPAWPLLAISCPSRMVIIAGASPGILKRMAVMEPA